MCLCTVLDYLWVELESQLDDNLLLVIQLDGGKLSNNMVSKTSSVYMKPSKLIMLYLSMLIMPGHGSSEAELTRSLLKDYEKLARPVNVTKEVGRHFKDSVL